MTLDNTQQLREAMLDLNRSLSLSDYEAVDVVWVAIIRIANLEDSQNEHKRLLKLLNKLPSTQITDLLNSPSVDAILSLDPPLESIRSFVHERLDVQRTSQELAAVRVMRNSDPRAALSSLAEILKRIRNRRAHGFKTPSGSRDQVILGATADILRSVCKLAIQLHV
jgi:hypothetical protein